MGSVLLTLVLSTLTSLLTKPSVTMLEMNIETLLQAAEYIERREREAEHGYASSPTSDQNQIISNKNQRLKNSTKKAHGSRSTHNELGKNRRAHLRSCLEHLNKAKHFIKNLEERDKKSLSAKDLLHREQRYLRRRLELLSEEVGVDIHKRRSISESSSSSVSSIQSSESDDVIYGGLSDDDHLSITSGGSNASDGGVTITTWRHLTIAEPKQ